MEQNQSNGNQNFSYQHLPSIQASNHSINSQRNNYEHTHLPRLKNATTQTSSNQAQFNTSSQTNRNFNIIRTSSITANNQNQINHSNVNGNTFSPRSPRRNII